MTGQELLTKLKEDESSVPSGQLIISGATGHEFMIRWNELLLKYDNDRIKVWNDLIRLYRIEYIPLEDEACYSSMTLQ